MARLGTTSRFMRQTANLSRNSPVASTQPAKPAGELTFTTGTTNLVVPRGVRKISVVAVTAGQAGYKCCYCCAGVKVNYYVSGAGGSLGWKNCIPVVPGETLTVTVDATSSGQPTVSINRGSLALVRIVNRDTTLRNGCIVTAAFHTARYCCVYSGAAGYLGNGRSGNNPEIGSGAGSGVGPSGGVALYGLGPDGKAGAVNGSAVNCVPNATFYGAGGRTGAGSPGGVRLVWGYNRAFPTNARKITP